MILRAVNKGRCCSLRSQIFSLIPFEILGRPSGTSAPPSAPKLVIYGTRHWIGMSAATLYLLENHLSYGSTRQEPILDNHSTIYAENKQRPWIFRKTYHEPRFIRHCPLILELGVWKSPRVSQVSRPSLYIQGSQLDLAQLKIRTNPLNSDSLEKTT